MMMQDKIQAKLTTALAPTHLEVENESYKHNVPKGAQTHFKVLIVSEAFEGLGLVDRHRRVNEALREELKKTLHALSIRALTPAQWEEQKGVPHETPPCLGGSKHDKASE